MENNLKQGDEVYIIWTSKLNYVKLDGVFLSYVEGKQLEKTTLFETEQGTITGEECFWILKKHIKKQEDILKYQKQIIPLQLSLSEHNFPQKVHYKELNKMISEKMSNRDKLKQFIQKYGFNPFDDSWIENILAENEIEKKWFKFTRDRNFPYPEQEIVDLFNHENETNITKEEARKLTVKKMRYILGSVSIRQQGNPLVDDWKENAIAYEKRFSDRDKRMDEWVQTRNGNFPWVTTKQPLEFLSGTHLLKCIEKIPHVFTSPDCDFIKQGIVLEVRRYDPIEKWIHLDFTPDVRELLLGTKEEIETDYAILLKPQNLNESLEGLDSF